MKSITLAVFAALLSTSVMGSPPSHESVEKLLTVLRTENEIEEKLTALDEMNRRGFSERFGHGGPLTADQQRSVELAVSTASSIMKQELSWEMVKPGLILIVQETFDQNELDEILKFYATPAGQAFLKKFPLIEQRSAMHLSALAEPAFERVQLAIEKALEDAQLPK